MRHLLIVENPATLALDIDGVEVVSAQSYILDPAYQGLKRARVYNLCRSTGYQTQGYYVSLLALARKHRAVPTIQTLQSLRDAPMIRLASREMEGQINQAFKGLVGDTFELSVYFGRNLAKRYDRLADALFAQFPAPLLRAEFRRSSRVAVDDRGKATRPWRLERVRLISLEDIPTSHHDFVKAQARRFFDRRTAQKRQSFRYDMGILVDPDEENPPSDGRALQRFRRAAEALGIGVDLLTRDDYGRIGQYDALFIRATTSVDHYTFRFALRAQAEGLVTIDDPESIVRCTNKVYLAEAFRRHGIPSPRTMVVSKAHAHLAMTEIGLPCVLKVPDGCFSSGVVRARDAQEFRAAVDVVFARSEMAVVQEYTPSAFDWRITVLGGAALFACKYHMAKGGWKIQDRDSAGRTRYGSVECFAIEDAPPEAIRLAVDCAAMIGDGLYGVDIKEIDGRFLVMEVNDNPSIEHRVEDQVLGDALYAQVMGHFLRKLEGRGRALFHDERMATL